MFSLKECFESIEQFQSFEQSLSPESMESIYQWDKSNWWDSRDSILSKQTNQSNQRKKPFSSFLSNLFP